MSIHRRTGWTVAILIILFILGTLFGFFKPIASVSRWVLLPVGRLFSSVANPIRSRLGQRAARTSCVERLMDLETRYGQRAVDDVRLRALEEENRNLRTLSKFLVDTGYDHVNARIISRGTGDDATQLLLDRGSRDGLEVGMAVVVGEGIFIGKITRIETQVAVLTTLSDVRSRVASARSGEHRVIGLLEGRGNNVSELTLVPQDIPLKPQEWIVTSGTEEKIPPNLVIGEIVDIQGQPTDPFKRATIEPLIRADQVDLVAVLRASALRSTPNAP